MRVALVHDDLVQWGGAERMLLGLCELFPEAPIYTSLYDSKNPLIQKNFKKRKVISSFLQRIPGWRSLYKIFLPLYPIAFEQFDFSEYDLVISHSSRFAKAIITKPQTTHLCWCLTPPRFLWHFSAESTSKLLSPLISFLRVFDRVTSKRVDLWLANSKNTVGRIQHIYHQEAQVLYPFIDLKRFQDVYPFDGGYYLVISRLNSYKKVDIAIKAAKMKGFRLKVVGYGPEYSNLLELSEGRVEFLSNLNDKMLTQVIAGCRGLIVTAEEDFGLTPLEANALGKPVVALKAGGALETVIQDQTGCFFDNQTPESLSLALEELEQKRYNKQACYKQAALFSKEVFLDNLKKVVSNIRSDYDL